MKSAKLGWLVVAGMIAVGPLVLGGCARDGAPRRVDRPAAGAVATGMTPQQAFRQSMAANEARQAARQAEQPFNEFDEMIIVANLTGQERRQFERLIQQRATAVEAGESRGEWRHRVMQALTPGQQALWGGHVLCNQARPAFRRIELTEAQAVAAHDICVQMAAEYIQGADLREDPYLGGLRRLRDPARERITAEVLTDEQRAQLGGGAARTAG